MVQLLCSQTRVLAGSLAPVCLILYTGAGGYAATNLMDVDRLKGLAVVHALLGIEVVVDVVGEANFRLENGFVTLGRHVLGMLQRKGEVGLPEYFYPFVEDLTMQGSNMNAAGPWGWKENASHLQLSLALLDAPQYHRLPDSQSGKRISEGFRKHYS